MKLKTSLTILIVALFLLAIPGTLLAQVQIVKGTVYESDQTTGVPGATVLEKGTMNGTVTDFDGKYSLELTGVDAVIVVQSMGFQPQEIKVENRTIIDVILEGDVVQLDDVVVTALGLSRKEKSLGYSVSKVESEDLNKTTSGNWLNAMSGKVAGLTFQSAGSGPTSSMRVTLRGDQSLTYGNNEALFVVDGIPINVGMTSTASGSNYANEDAPVDFGNGATDINPQDIESISVLKGPAATALYGSRAANGAIIITTKSGRKDKGLGVTFSSTTTFEKASYFPDFQTEYGNGSDMGYDEFSLWEITEEMASDGIAQARHYSRYGFGEKYDETKLRYLYASKNWDTNEYTKLPWVYQDDWYTGLFQTGVTTNNTITIDGNDGEGTSSRLSFTDLHNKWILPNTGYNKQTVSLSYNTKINKFLKLNAKVNYYKKTSDNMPVGGYDETNPMYALVWGFSVNSIDDWKNEYFEGRYNYTNWNAQGENGLGLVYPSTSSYNPYRTLYEELNSVDKDRILGNIDLTVDIAKGLTLDIRSGLDWYDEFRTQRKPFYTTGAINGFYREQNIKNVEMNSDFLFQYVNNDLINEHLALTFAFGGNNMTRHYFSNKVTLSELGEEGIYHIENLPTGVFSDPDNYRKQKVINSLYGIASLSWDETYFIDITGRNDWSSTLAPNNWSYFYPSVSTSILLSKALDFESRLPWVDFMKLRISWANVGNDTDSYKLDQTYNSDTGYPGGYLLTNTIPDPLIQPENIESWETGLDARFFNNRLSFDVALYNSSSTNQIVTMDVDQITGATGVVINAGEIQNKGIELASRFVPVRTKDFEWSFTFTWSKNKNILVSLLDGWDPEQPWQTDMGTTIGSRTYIYSFIGEEMNWIYGRGFQTAPEGAYYIDENGEQVDASGMTLVDSNGYPILDEQPTTRIGKVSPDWRAGMTQSISYKNLSLSATFSGQLGGNAYSVTNFALSYTGKLNNSIEGRYDGLVHEGVNAITNADGTITYTKNTTITSDIETYYNIYIWNRNNTLMNTFSTSFLKMKELRLDYRFDDALLRKTKIVQGAKLGVFATNLFCLTEFPQYDPETGMLDGSNILSGIESMSFPMTRSYGVNVEISF